MKPLGTRIIVRPTPRPEVTSSGLILPQLEEYKATTGTVIAVGSGKVYSGNVLVPNFCKVGDTVCFTEQAGANASFEGEDLIVLKEEEIMAVIEG